MNVTVHRIENFPSSLFFPGFNTAWITSRPTIC